MKVVVKTRSLPFCRTPTAGPKTLAVDVLPEGTVLDIKIALSKAAGGVAKLRVGPNRFKLSFVGARGKSASWNDLDNDCHLAEYGVGAHSVLGMKVLPQEFEAVQHCRPEWKPFMDDKCLIRFGVVTPLDVWPDPPQYELEPEQDLLISTSKDCLEMLVSSAKDRHRNFMDDPHRVKPSERHPPKQKGSMFRTTAAAVVTFPK
jgi:hypothetical protein